jgi:hypothetical protein
VEAVVVGSVEVEKHEEDGRAELTVRTQLELASVAGVGCCLKSALVTSGAAAVVHMESFDDRRSAC